MLLCGFTNGSVSMVTFFIMLKTAFLLSFCHRGVISSVIAYLFWAMDITQVRRHVMRFARASASLIGVTGRHRLICSVGFCCRLLFITHLDFSQARGKHIYQHIGVYKCMKTSHLHSRMSFFLQCLPFDQNYSAVYL